MKKRKKIKARNILLFLFVLTIGIISVGTVLVSAYSSSIDYSFDEELFIATKSGNVTRIYYDANGVAENPNNYKPVIFEEIYGGVNKKLWTPYSEISNTIKNSFVSMEDRGFFEHSGVDYRRSIGALLNYFFHFKSSFGGSTITQQLVKNISGDNERSIKRKINEVFRAGNIEKNHSKEEIFEAYLNIVSMSENIVGVGEAAKIYFGKSANELDYAEAAVLVGIANAPTKYNPYKNPKECLEKRNRVLYSVFLCGYINEEEYNEYISRALGVLEKSEDDIKYTSWFAETLLNDIAYDLSEKNDISMSTALKYIYNSGLDIYSTVCPEMQKILENYFENLNNFPSAVNSGLEYSMVISSPDNGNLLALVGGVGEKKGDRLLNYANVNITPGSTLKPLALYAPLIDEGKINWATVFDDVPVEFNKQNDGTYTVFPKNAPEVYDGLTNVKDALRLSKNTVAVRMYNILGGEKIYQNLTEKFGFKSLCRRFIKSDGTALSDIGVSPLALGQLTNGISLRSLTEAYNVFPNEGELPKGRSYVAVFDRSGNIILQKESESKTVFSKDSARIMNKLLENVVNSGTAATITLKEIMDTAGKTGTSGSDFDRLFVGYTPYFTAGIWCGYSGKKQSIGRQSISHIEIWDNIMNEVAVLYKDVPERNFSIDGLVYLPYCKDSGKMYTEKCIFDARGNRLELGYFSNKSIPQGSCETHVMYKYDSLTSGVAHSGCDELYLEDIALIKVESRSFPCEVIVTDAEFVCRDIEDGIRMPDMYDVPFFQYSLPPDVYVGRSKGRKQYNSFCYLHYD